MKNHEIFQEINLTSITYPYAGPRKRDTQCRYALLEFFDKCYRSNRASLGDLTITINTETGTIHVIGTTRKLTTEEAQLLGNSLTKRQANLTCQTVESAIYKACGYTANHHYTGRTYREGPDLETLLNKERKTAQ